MSSAATRIRALLTRATDLARAGRPAEAIFPLRQAAALDPVNAAIRHDLGYVYLRSGRFAEAVAAFEAALAANPGFALASLRLGSALQAQGEDTGALAAYQRARVLQPSLTEASLRAGILLETRGQRAEAAEAFRNAAATAPNTRLGLLAHARLMLAEGNDDKAERSLRQLLALSADDLDATALLATVLADAGRLIEARECYERVTATSPDYAGCYYDLVRCRRLAAEEADLVSRMRAVLTIPELHPETRTKVHLALGNAADDAQDYAEAMRHFDAADAVRASLGSFDHAIIERRVDDLIAHTTSERIARARTVGRNDPTPILIVGLPRSGTTLVEQILSCHPDVHPGGELPFWTARGATWEQGRSANQPAFLAQAAADYISVLRTLSPGSARVTDKMPLNIFWAGMIHMALPRATIVHCRRSPIDTALSIHRTYFNQHVAFPTGGQALVATILAVERLAAHWRTVLPADRFVELDYESLTEVPEPTIRVLVAACGLSWNSACLQPERNPRIVRTPSKWQVRQPISRRSTEAWRRYEPWLGSLAALVPK